MRPALIALVVAGGLAAPTQVDVSRAPGSQNEPAVAVDPSHPQILVAGSNSASERLTRVYGSTDGGLTWTSAPGPPLPATAKLGGADPAVTIDGAGRQFFAVSAAGPYHASVYVASRGGPAAAWVTPAHPVAPLKGALYDDKPALATDLGRGRLYAAWTRASARGLVEILVARSDDGARSWSRPARVDDPRDHHGGTYASIAAGADGTVYVTWWTGAEILVDRSTDGGRSFARDRLVATYLSPHAPTCEANGTPIPAAPADCVRPNPIVTTAAGEVRVTWGDSGPRGGQRVRIAALGPALRALGPPRAIAAPRGEDDFWPVSAAAPDGKALWLCFYAAREAKAVFTCTVSRDGGRTWADRRAAASVASDESHGNAAGSHGLEYGDYEGLAVGGDGVAHPIWTDTRNRRARAEEIYTTALR